MLSTLKNFKNTYSIGWFDTALMVMMVYVLASSAIDTSSGVHGSSWGSTALIFMFLGICVTCIAMRSAISHQEMDLRHFYRRGSLRVYGNGRWSIRTLKVVYRTAYSALLVGAGYVLVKNISVSWELVLWAIIGGITLALCLMYILADYVNPDSSLAELERYRDEGWGIIDALNREHPEAYGNDHAHEMVRRFIDLSKETPNTPAGLESTISMTAHMVTALNMELKKVNGDA